MKRILWVEDDAWMLDELMRPIRHSGVEVEIATTYISAQEKLEAGKHFDAVVVDLILPFGYEVRSSVLSAEKDEQFLGILLLRKIAAHYPNIPMYVLTAVLDRNVERLLSNLGVRRILKKPISPSELRNALLETISEL